jgi:hypothetical protein
MHMTSAQKSEVYIAPFSNQKCTRPHLINGSVDGIIHRPPVHFPSLTNTMFIISFVNRKRKSHRSSTESNYGINSSNGSEYINIHQLKVSIVFTSSRSAYLTVRYHSGGSMKLNACILFLAHMVYL